MPDPIKDMLTQGASQVGMMNTQIATGLATALTTGANQLNMMAIQMTAGLPDLGAAAPAGLPMLPGLPSMGGRMGGGMAAAPAPAPVAAPTYAPAYAPRMIR
jgi:hypothetical protein